MINMATYKNYDDLEEHLTVDEVNRLFAAIMKQENEGRRFSAALKGIKLSSPEEEYDKELRDQVKRRVQARKMGITVEELNEKIGFQEAGIKLEVDQA